MDQHIVHLTDYLISKHGFDNLGEVQSTPRSRTQFIKHVAIHLEAGELQKMKPSKLGEILGELKLGDMDVSREDLLVNVHFAGDCLNLLRSLVASCLAHVIYERLFHSGAQIPPYMKRSPRSR